MSKQNNKKTNGVEGNERTTANSEEIMKVLAQRGIIQNFDGDKIKNIRQEKKKKAYHNTLLLLKNYRTIAWMGDNNAETENTYNTENAADKPERDKSEQPVAVALDESEYAVEEPKELSPEEQLQQAMATPCPITKFAGKSLGEVLTMDPNAINWVATKFTGDENIRPVNP